MINRVLLNIDGKPHGLIEALGRQPLTAKDLEPIPADALMAFAARVNAEKLVQSCQDVSGQESKNPENTNPSDEHPASDWLTEKLAAGLAHRLCASLGDTWCLYNSPTEGEVAFYGWTAVAGVRDRAALLQCLDVLAAPGGSASDVAGSLKLPDGSSVQIKKCRFSGHVIYYLSGQAIAPALTITEHEAVATLNLPAMKAYLGRRDHHSLAAQPGVRLALADSHPPAALGYCDTPRLFDFLYPMIAAYGIVVSSAGEQFGVDFKPTCWPSAPAIRRHLRPDITTLERTPNGLQLTCRYCLPSGGANGILAMMALGVFGNNPSMCTSPALPASTWTPTWNNPFHLDSMCPPAIASAPQAIPAPAPACNSPNGCATPAVAATICPTPSAGSYNGAACCPITTGSSTAPTCVAAHPCIPSVPSPSGSSTSGQASPYGVTGGYGTAANPYSSTPSPYGSSSYASPALAAVPTQPYSSVPPVCLTASGTSAYGPAPIPAAATDGAAPVPATVTCEPTPASVAVQPSPVPTHATTSADADGNRIEIKEIPGPVNSAGSDTAAEPPTQAEVMKALEKAHGDAAPQHRVTRSKVRMLIEPAKDALDSPFDAPQLGRVQMHHVQFKCTIYYTETAQVDLPSPHKTVDENCKEVIYVNRDHLHRAGNSRISPVSIYAGRYVFAIARSTSATLHACATQPRGVCGDSASNTSLMVPRHDSPR